MNQRTAKRIKKEIYGDYEPSLTRRYYTKEKTGSQIYRDELRRKYQAAKKSYIKTKGE